MLAARRAGFAADSTETQSNEVGGNAHLGPRETCTQTTGWESLQTTVCIFSHKTGQTGGRGIL